ncbi:MAG: bifunctional alpha/beta hydrolase/OsmC family protein [Microscillaceae bacterium]|nr:bifunctional alpha/beta hydrolase/OsmC family protein [Microscillaceae bacterium]
MQSLKLNFKNSQGEALSARLELPIDSHPHNYAVFAHCFTCNKNLHAVRSISKALTKNGIAVLSFDFTGLGESEGDFADTNFSSNVQDLVEAARFLEQSYQSPSLLIGHSLGGAAVLAAKQFLPGIKAIATVGAPYDPAHVSHLIEDTSEIESKGIAHVKIGGRGFTLKKQFLDDLKEISTGETIRNLGAALLVMHSPQDETVEIDNATQIYKAAQHPRSFISLDGANHLLSDRKDSLYVGDMIATWAQHYLEIPEEEDLSTSEQVVTRTGKKGYTTEIKAGRHRLTGDEPVAVGGHDFGPNPYDFLNIALGTCTGMTLRMYADRKGWPLKEVKVHLKHHKIHAQDCNDCENKEGKIDHIERIIELEGELDESQLQRLLEIADKCPVHRTLHSEVKVKTELRREE